MIRDEISKLLDIRIPPNGYRRYIKEVGRTGGFQDTQRDDCLIVLCQAVEELQKEIIELRQHPNINPFNDQSLMDYLKSEDAKKHTLQSEEPKFECITCGISFKQRIGLEGHKRGKGHKDAVINAA